MDSNEVDERLERMQGEIDDLFILLQHAQNLVDALEREPVRLDVAS